MSEQKKAAPGEELAAAWRQWLESDKGKQCIAGDAHGRYLENRLWWAFMAGAESAEMAIKTESK
jgi:hypothetical protein